MRKFFAFLIVSLCLLPYTCGAYPQTDKVIPVLMYHAVSDKIWGGEELFVSPSTLEAQLEYLTKNGYTPITFEDIPCLDSIENPIMLTFDDGYRDNFTNAYPILQKYNAKATFFIITDTLNHPLYMDADMVREVSDSGLISVQSHTVHHLCLTKLDKSKLDDEMRISAETVADVTGKEPVAVCYPFGACNTDVYDTAAKYYDWGVCIEGRAWKYNGETMKVTRLQVKRSTTMDEFIHLIKGK